MEEYAYTALNLLGFSVVLIVWSIHILLFGTMRGFCFACIFSHAVSVWGLSSLTRHQL